jgi:hypothetical protein
MPTVISVGRPFPGLRPQPVPGVRGLLDDRHATLHPVAAHPPRENTPEDVAAFETGRVRLGLARWSERTCFLLFAVEGFCRWSDAPMAPFDGRARSATSWWRRCTMSSTTSRSWKSCSRNRVPEAPRVSKSVGEANSETRGGGPDPAARRHLNDAGQEGSPHGLCARAR